MMSLEAFADRCAHHIKHKEPFLAYRHESGYCFLRLGPVEITKYTVELYSNRAWTAVVYSKTALEALKSRNQVVTVKEETYTKTAAKSTVTGLRKAIQKMKKDRRTAGTLSVVECDGAGWSAEGEVVDLLMGVLSA